MAFLGQKEVQLLSPTNFMEKPKKEEDKAITVFVGSDIEDSNLTQSSYHITVEEGPDVDDANDDV